MDGICTQAARDHITELSMERDSLLQEFDIYRGIAEQAQVSIYACACCIVDASAVYDASTCAGQVR
jgi:hypothetical protein